MSVEYSMFESYMDAITSSKVLPAVIRFMQFIVKLELALQLVPANILQILLFPGNSSSNFHSKISISLVNSLISFSVTSHSRLSFVAVSDLGTGVFVGMDVFVGTGVLVGKGVFVGAGVEVEGTGVGAGAHPLTKIAKNTNARKIAPIDFFMILSPFELIVQRSRRTVSVTCWWLGREYATLTEPTSSHRNCLKKDAPPI